MYDAWEHRLYIYGLWVPKLKKIPERKCGSVMDQIKMILSVPNGIHLGHP